MHDRLACLVKSPIRMQPVRAPGCRPCDAVQDPRYALVPLPASLDVDGRAVPRVHPAFTIAGAVAIGSFLLGLPLLSICVLATGGVVAVVAGSAIRTRTGGPRPIAPDEIASHEAREAYRNVLAASLEVERAIAASPQLRSSVAPVLERSRAAMLLCGRTALLANPLQEYLDSHDPARLRIELERLRARAEAATDDQAAAAWSHATSARVRQLATYEQMRAMRDRIVARLELVRAALEAFAAMIVRLQVSGEEQLLIAGESVIEHLDGVDQELAAFASALAADPGPGGVISADVGRRD
jgi:hypothetical protein